VAKIIIAFYILATSCALTAVKFGSKTGALVHHVDNRLVFNINFYTVAGIFLYGVSFLIYMYLISRYDLGYIVPLTTAFIYILIFGASYFIFHEVFTAAKIVGIVFIVTGLIFLNLKK
jgi:drug/metabolite transporter (DMT)-like permease